MDADLLEQITARRADWTKSRNSWPSSWRKDEAELDELAAAERVFERVSEQLADERASAAPPPGQVGGRAVMLIPHRAPDVEENMLPPDYRASSPSCGRRPGRSWPGRSARCWGWTSAYGPN
ncbi:hypothetical protein ACF073_23530 [Streptomyces sp. NPDC015171]|uniref:hypothetical protein n=1 Tax=Streptomyces sp. NPDC015171 TaxID=3364945 RepID=UPI0036FBD9D3